MKRAKLRIASQIGHVETLVNDPGDVRKGIAFIAHPHPLHGGSMDNKVVQCIAQLCHDEGYVAVRPNFRGVGNSDGVYTGGEGESEDMLAVIAFVRGHYDASLPIVLAGFSFGAYVQHRVAQQLPPSKLVLISPAVNLFHFDQVPDCTTIIHGQDDEIVPFDEACQFACDNQINFRPIAGAGHFYHGKLVELKTEMLQACHL
uniref:Putative alpha/beta-Hydrolase n=1 Tax=mine drainage metagenome TaxID=410659 RepID=E6QR41_9ZZZZ